MTADINKTGRRVHASVAHIIRIANTLSEAMAHVGLLLVSLFMLLQIVEIVGRKIFVFSILGLSEIGQLLVMSCISLVLPFVFIREGHIAVEFLTDRFGPFSFALVKAIVALISAVFVMVLAYFGFKQGWSQILKGDVSPTLEIPIVWYWVPLLVGIIASCLNCLILSIGHFCEAIFGLDARPDLGNTDNPDHIA